MPEARKQPETRSTGRPPERSTTPRRFHEVVGILTLASALLLGPSLASVQFGDGSLMGPFGNTLGRALNSVVGLTGYLVVASLVVVAFRIFAGGLGLSSGGRPFFTLWRERIGTVLATLFIAVLLHLLVQPTRIAGASAGGLVGELGAEVLRSLVSTPGAWVVSLTGLALSLTLATNLSWARLAVAAWRGARRSWGLSLAGWAVARSRMRLTMASLAEVLRRRQEVTADSNGAAALPPVVRIDLSELVGRGPEPAVDGAPPDRAALPGDPDAMPRDLEIGPPDHGDATDADDPPAAPRIVDPRRDAAGLEIVIPEQISEPLPARLEVMELDHEVLLELDLEPPRPPSPAATEPAAEPATPDARGPAAGKTAVPASEPGAQPADEAPDPQSGAGGSAAAADAEGPELTIVESSFAQGPIDDDTPPAERQVEEPGEGPGFVLSGESYRHPPLSLLDYEGSSETNIDREAIYAQADRLVKTLGDYKIRGRVTEVHPGPVVTMYEFVPAPGTRISKVANLADDLAMSLTAQRVRIVAPIPGKGAIGIEVPNKQRDTVYFKEIVGHETFRKSKGQLPLALGKNIVGAPVSVDLARMPHLLVAGATGAGKSVSINAMICSLLMRCTPDECRLIMVDPKYLELSGYNDIPHLMLPVVTDPSKANIALRWAVREMERRYQLLADMRVRDIKSFNRKVDKLRGEAGAEAEAEERATRPGPEETLEEARPSRILVVRKNDDGSEVPVNGDDAADDDAARPQAEQGEPTRGRSARPAQQELPLARKRRRRRGRHDGPIPERLPYIVVVIDEFADLMMVASKEVETSVARLAQKARAAGIHVILATQRPSVDVITGLIKANFPSRVSFQVASGHDSKTILGSQGAENLLGSGDMLILDRGAEMKRVHGAFISDAEIGRVVEWLRDQGRPVYDMDILKPPEDEEQAPEPEEQVDEMYDQAVRLVAETRQASISMIQRRLRVGYNRAARMVERMEREGVVGPPDGVKGREVLVNPI